MKNKFIYLLFVGIILFVMGVAYSVSTFLNLATEVKKVDDILVIQDSLEEGYLVDLDDNNYTIDNPKVVLNPYEISPLTAIIMFNTNSLEEVKVTIVGKDDKSTITHTFEPSNKHIIPIYGLYADYENKVILNVGELEKEIIIKTDPLPEDFVVPTSVFVNRNKVNNDLIFVTPATRGYTAAYDINGEPRWYLVGNYAWDISRLSNGRIMLGSNRPIAPPYHTVGPVELDLTGKIYKEYVIPGGYHHDVSEMEDGNLLVASNNFIDGTVEDYIVLIDRETGDVLKEWDLKEILPVDKGKSAMWDEYDWFHNNAVWYDDNNNSIILSGRHQDAVISIDFDSGDLNWIIGDSTNWGSEMQKYFFRPIGDNFEWQWAQHASMVLPNGDIFILDNGNNRSKIEDEYISAKDNYTRGVIYRINTNDMTIKQMWQYGKERGSDFYSPYISDVDYYSIDHYLVHSGGIGEKDNEPLNVPAPFMPDAKLSSITTEILDNEIIFELELPSNFYRAEKLSLYGDHNLEFKEGERLGALGKTNEYKPPKRINLLVLDTEVPKEYNIKFQKEIDRLVFKATLLEGTKVRVILDNLFDRKVYASTVSNKAYTAMCIDIFNENNIENPEEINITKYINDEGLKGKYNIYLQIDDKIYNTKQYVRF